MYKVGEYVQVKWTDKVDRLNGIYLWAVYKVIDTSCSILKCVDAQGTIQYLSKEQVRPSTKELFK